jgi:aldose 1-epimerase
MIEPFGTLEDGSEVQQVTLGTPNGLQAQVLTYGGILRRLTFPVRGTPRDMIVTLPDLGSYVRDTSFQGILVGRVGNRIADARFTLGGSSYSLTANDGPNQLHGGVKGFGKRIWNVVDVDAGARSRLVLQRISPDGEEGYPGNLTLTAEILVEDRELRLTFEALGDAPTPVNLTYHPYFNLSGDITRAVDEMVLRIPASRFLPVRSSQLIPTGEIAPVAGTPFDFRAARAIEPPPTSSHPQLGFGGGYDHCWVLDDSRDCDAELFSPHSGVTLNVKSSQPGIQFYGGQYLHGAHPGLKGVCIEPQGFPNAVNAVVSDADSGSGQDTPSDVRLPVQLPVERVAFVRDPVVRHELNVARGCAGSRSERHR